MLGFKYTNWRGEYQEAVYIIILLHVFVTEYIMSAVGENSNLNLLHGDVSHCYAAYSGQETYQRVTLQG